MYLSSPDTADCSMHRSCVDIHIQVDISTLSRYTYLNHLSIIFDILRQIDNEGKDETMNQTELLTCKSNLYIFIYPVTLSGQMRAKVTHSDVGPLCFAFCYFHSTVGGSKIHTKKYSVFLANMLIMYYVLYRNR